MSRPLRAASWSFDGHDRPGLACATFTAATLLAAAVAVFMIGTCINDVRAERVLDRPGVTTQATFLDTHCGKCSTLPVAFRTTDGRRVTADLPVAGDPDHDTVSVRYDPEHPSRVHPSNGVVYDEVLSGAFGTGAVVGFGCAARELLQSLRMLRGRRNRRWPAGNAEPAQVSHVRVVGS